MNPSQHGAGFPGDPQQQQYQEYDSNQSNEGVNRSSPFASGPVAMVNQVRPGVSIQNSFPGLNTRENPNQLATPLRHSDEGSNLNSLTGSFSAPMDPFQSLEMSTPFQLQPSAAAPNDLFQRIDNVNTLFGDNTNGASRPQHRSPAYESLFAAPTPSNAQPPPAPVRNTQSFSYGQSNRPLFPPEDPNQQQYTQQQQTEQYQPQSGGALHRSYSEAPPPAAPFLGYSDNSRASSFRTANTPDRALGFPTSQPPTQGVASLNPGYSTSSPSSSSLFPSNTSSGSIVVYTPSVDDLLQEMIRLSYDESGGSIDTGSPCLAAGAPPKLVVSELPNQIDTLEQLYHQKKWKSLTKKALGMLQQPCNDSRRTLEIKAWWLAGLVKEGQNENAKSVVEQISTQIEELETNVWNGKDTSFLYMRLRLLEAIVYCKNCTTTNDLHEKKLFVLISKLSKAIVDHKNSSNIYSKWLRIAQFTLVNHLIHENKFALALRVCSSIQIPNDPHQKLLFASRFGRIYLQMGDLLMAEKFFQEAKTLGASSGSLRLLLNDGLLLFAQNKLQDALNVFYQILHQSFHQSSQVTSGQQEKEEEEEDIVNVAVNNYAICALYCCDVRGAVNTLEQMIRSDPLRHLNGILVFNLSSLYDLIYDNTNSTNRKEMIKKIAEMYDVEHIDPTCFRV